MSLLKRIKKFSLILPVQGAVGFVTLVWVGFNEVLAAGGSPYGPHVPEDTGLELSPLYLLAILLYITGMALLVYSKLFRDVIERDLENK